jgi:hypothetical protein
MTQIYFNCNDKYKWDFFWLTFWHYFIQTYKNFKSQEDIKKDKKK